jgi:hypothetical protein
LVQDTYHFPAAVVATKSFTKTYDGDQVEIIAGSSQVVGDHEIVRQHPGAFRSLSDPEPVTPAKAFARYANEHGMDAALAHLVEIIANRNYAGQERQAREQWARQPTAEQRDEAARRFAQRREQASRTAYTRARNEVMAAARLSSSAAAAAGPIVGVRVPAAARERRERPRARRCQASRDGPGELDESPPPPASPRRRPGVRS